MTIATLGPIAADGKPFFLPNIYPGNVILNFGGRPDANGTRYGGALFGMEKEGVGDVTTEFSYQDGVFLTGGGIIWSGGGFGSYVALELLAPASEVEDPAHPNQGNCNLVGTGLGFNLIVPAAGDGLKSVKRAVPIPAEDDETDERNGYWNYSDPWIGEGEVSGGEPQASKYNMFDAPIPLCHFCDVHLLLNEGQRDLVVQNIKPKWVLPQWKFKVTLHNAQADKTLRVGWDLVLARKRGI